MKNDILTLTKKMVSIPSTADNADRLQEVLDTALKELDTFTIERFERGGIQSALVYAGTTRPKKFGVLFNVHLDVIPGKSSQYLPRTKGNRLYGAGVMDMKANAACAILVFRELARELPYPIALQLTTDEEVGGFDGTKYQVEKGVRADFVIATEPTNFDIVHQAKGVLWVKISVKGKSAHGAYPWRGDNAVMKTALFLDALMKRFSPPKKESWVTTVNVARIETTNETLNKIPDDCTVWLDIRFVPKDAKKIASEIKKLLPKGCTMEIVANEPALYTSEDNRHLAALRIAAKKITKKNIAVRGAQGSSDARHFERVRCSGVEFGPIGGGIGSDQEWVDVRSLETYCRILKEFLLSLT